MCNIKDAKRWIKLAELQTEEGDKEAAKISYLEAASIYVLQAQFQNDDHLLKHANEYYQKSKEVIGEKFNQELSKQELAKRTITELNQKTITLEMLKQEIANV